MDETTGGATVHPRERMVVVPPRGFFAFEIAAGERLEVVDVEGQQCCDLVCFDAENPRERASTHATVMRNGSVYLTAGHRIYSTSQQPLMDMVADSVGAGGHDLLAGMCSEESTRSKFGIADAPNCTDNLRQALEPFGIGPELIVDSLNLFMRMPVEPDGSVRIEEPLSKAGDSVVLEAIRPCLIAISNCPQEWGTTNARALTNIGLHVTRP